MLHAQNRFCPDHQTQIQILHHLGQIPLVPTRTRLPRIQSHLLQVRMPHARGQGRENVAGVQAHPPTATEIKFICLEQSKPTLAVPLTPLHV